MCSLLITVIATCWAVHTTGATVRRDSSETGLDTVELVGCHVSVAEAERGSLVTVAESWEQQNSPSDQDFYVQIVWNDGVTWNPATGLKGAKRDFRPFDSFTVMLCMNVVDEANRMDGNCSGKVSTLKRTWNDCDKSVVGRTMTSRGTKREPKRAPESPLQQQFQAELKQKMAVVQERNAERQRDEAERALLDAALIVQAEMEAEFQAAEAKRRAEAGLAEKLQEEANAMAGVGAKAEPLDQGEKEVLGTYKKPDATPYQEEERLKGPLQEGWDEVPTPDGKLYYWNQATSETTWERPVIKAAQLDGELEDGWEAVVSPDGRTYYWKENVDGTDETTWTPPLKKASSFIEMVRSVSSRQCDMTVELVDAMLEEGDAPAERTGDIITLKFEIME